MCAAMLGKAQYCMLMRFWHRACAQLIGWTLPTFFVCNGRKLLQLSTVQGDDDWCVHIKFCTSLDQYTCAHPRAVQIDRGPRLGQLSREAGQPDDFFWGSTEREWTLVNDLGWVAFAHAAHAPQSKLCNHHIRPISIYLSYFYMIVRQTLCSRLRKHKSEVPLLHSFF